MPTFGGYEYWPTPLCIARRAYVNKLIAKGCSVGKAEAVAWRKYR